MYGSQKFEDFVDTVIDPKVEQVAETEKDSDEPAWEVEAVKGERKKHGVIEYKIKWRGFNNRHNRWVPEVDLSCDDLIEHYESASAIWRHVDHEITAYTGDTSKPA